MTTLAAALAEIPLGQLKSAGIHVMRRPYAYVLLLRYQDRQWEIASAPTTEALIGVCGAALAEMKAARLADTGLRLVKRASAGGGQ